MSQQVRGLSRKQLGSQIDNITTTSDYFSALENNFSDKNDLLEFLINLTGYLNYHSESGSINVKKKLEKCREKLREFQVLHPSIERSTAPIYPIDQAL
jgi:hypothetical protein